MVKNTIYACIENLIIIILRSFAKIRDSLKLLFKDLFLIIYYLIQIIIFLYIFLFIQIYYRKYYILENFIIFLNAVNLKKINKYPFLYVSFKLIFIDFSKEELHE